MLVESMRQNNKKYIIIRIIKKEVKDVCIHLKTGKAPGPENIPIERLKYGSDKLFAHLTVLFQNCINTGQIPEKWKLPYLTPIYKKDGKENCENIGVLQRSISRIYDRVLQSNRKRLRPPRSRRTISILNRKINTRKWIYYFSIWRRYTTAC